MGVRVSWEKRESRRDRRLRRISLVCLVTFFLQCIPPVWAIPEIERKDATPPEKPAAPVTRVRGPALDPQVQRILERTGAGLESPLADIPGVPGAQFFPNPLEVAHQPQASPSPAKPENSPKPEGKPSPSETPAAPTPSPKPQDPPAWSIPKASPTPAPSSSRRPESRERCDDDDHEDEDDDDDGHGHGHPHHPPRPRPKGPASVVVIPASANFGELASADEFSRQPNSAQPVYPMEVVAGQPQAYSTDDVVLLTKSYADPEASETIRFDLFSPLPQNNSTRKNTAATAEWRYLETGSADGFDAAHTLELRVWDDGHPRGYVARRQQEQGHLTRLELGLTATARDLGNYRWVVRRNQTSDEKTFRVTDPPTPDGAGWVRRNAARYVAAEGTNPVVAFANDEWLLRSAVVDLPEPPRRGRSGGHGHDPKPLEKTVRWSWFPPATPALPKTSQQRSYYTVERHYWSDGRTWKIVTHAWDAYYPKKGRTVRTETGSGRLPEMRMTEGTSLPVAGNWTFQQEVDGKKSPKEKISVRELTLSAGNPSTLGRGLRTDEGGATFEMGFRAQGWIPSRWSWTLELRDVTTGELLKTLTGEVTQNTQAEPKFYASWDGYLDGTQEEVVPGTVVQPILEVRIPPSAAGVQRARAQGARLAAAAEEEPHVLVAREAQPCEVAGGTCNCKCPPVPLSIQSPIKTTIDNALGFTSHTFADLAIPTRGLPIVLGRHHDSHDDRDMRGLGPNNAVPRAGWSFSFNHEIRPDPLIHPESQAGDILYVRPDGVEDRFRLVGGEWQPQTDHTTCKLRRTANHWEISFKGGTKFEFRLDGLLHRQLDPNGNTLFYHWGANGALDQITAPDGQSLTFSWTQGTPPQPLLVAEPPRWDYGPGLIVRRPGLPIHRGPFPNLEPYKTVMTATDHTGRKVVYEWWPEGWFIAGIYAYPGRYALQRVTQPGGKVFEHDYRHNEFLQQLSLRATRLNGVLQEEIFTDLNGFLGRAIHRAPHDDAAVPVNVHEMTFSRQRDSTGHLLLGSEVTYLSGSAAGPQDLRTWTFEFDHHASIEKMTDPMGNATEYDWCECDTKNDLKSMKNARGFTTHFEYDSRRNIHKVTDALNHTTELNWSDKDELQSIKDATGAETLLTYDDRSNVTGIRDASGHQTIMTYRPDGLLETARDGLGNTWQFGYDTRGFLNSITAPPAHTGEPAAVWTFENDELGRRKIARTPPTPGEPLGSEVRYDYDARGHLEKVHLPAVAAQHLQQALPEATLTYLWDSRDLLQSVTDAANRTVSYGYDAGHNLVRVIGPSGDGSLMPLATLRYDARENLTLLTTPSGSTSYEYDALDRLKQRTLPGNSVETFTYDPNSNLETWQDPVSAAVYHYDEADRLSRVEASNGGATEKLLFGYNERDELTSARSDGALSSVLEWEYYPNGGLKRVTADGRTIQYVFDLADRLTSMTDPDSVTTAYGWNNRGELDFAESDGQRVTYGYDLAGRQTSKTLPNGVTCQRAFDARSRLLKLAYQKGSDELLLSLKYNSDQLGRRRQIERHTGRSHQLYQHEYDSRDQLQQTARFTRESGSWAPLEATTYGYDANHNRTSVLRQPSQGPAESTTYSYSGSGNDQLLGPGDYTYHANGATKSGDGYSYKYNHRGQITKVYSADSYTSYAYDALGRRIVKAFDGALPGASPSPGTNPAHSAIRYLWSGSDVVKEYSDDGSVKAQYLMGGGREGIRAGSAPSASPSPAPQPSASPIIVAQVAAAQATTPGRSWTGTWDTDYGVMTLVQTGSTVTGTYTYENGTINGTSSAPINGTVSGPTLTGVWTEIGGSGPPYGTISFTMSADGRSFTGLWNYYSDPPSTSGWNGRRLTPVPDDEPAPAWNWYLTDHLGSTAMLTDSTGQVVAEYDYGDFGETTQTFGDPGLYNPYRYTGQQFDPEAGPGGLYFLRARSYSPKIGRFLSRDPIGYAGGSNLYAYCGNDPVNWRDPSGTAPDPLAALLESLRNAGTFESSGTFTMLLAPELAEVAPALGMVAGPAMFTGGIYAFTAIYQPSIFRSLFPFPLPGGLTPAPASLYHYTSECGLEGILNSQEIWPSTKAANPKDARYGDGQYFSDITPGSKSPAQLSREFLGFPFQASRFTHYVQVDVKGLRVRRGRQGVYVILNDTNLDVTGRVMGSGAH